MVTQSLPKTPQETWQRIRTDDWRGVTSGVAPGHVQANLAILPKVLAFDFLLFCPAEPPSCPLLEVIEPGQVEPRLTAPARTSVPTSHATGFYEKGEFTREWTPWLTSGRTTWCLSCWGAASPLRPPCPKPAYPCGTRKLNCNVPMYVTSIDTNPAGAFSGPMVVQHAPGAARQDSAGSYRLLPVSRRPTAPRTHRRPGGNRHQGHRPPRLWRCGGYPPRGKSRYSGPAG